MSLELSVEQARNALERMADEVSEYAGIPFPMPGIGMNLHRRHRLRDVWNEITEARLGEHPVLAYWDCRRLGVRVFVTEPRPGRRSFISWDIDKLTLQRAINTLLCSDAWDFEAETKALQKLYDLVGLRKWQQYLLTGGFVESSARSNVRYWFRRGRPTLALRDFVDRDGTEDARCLAALCHHPIGYYQESHAGALCPTDDVIAHLLLMRSDERRFWAVSNQHPAGTPESAI